MGEWIIIVEMIIEAIQQSIENRNRGRACVEKDLCAGAPRIRITLWLLLRKHTDLVGKELHQEVKDGMGFLASMSPQEVAALCDEAQAAK